MYEASSCGNPRILLWLGDDVRITLYVWRTMFQPDQPLTVIKTEDPDSGVRSYQSTVHCTTSPSSSHTTS
jgi:hypothetical protein